MAHTLPIFARRLSMLALGAAFTLTSCGGGSGGGGLPIGPQPTATPISTSADCPASGTLPMSYTTSASIGTLKRGISGSSAGQHAVPGQIAITYSSDLAPGTLSRAAEQVRGSRIADLDYRDLAVRTRIIAVDPSDMASAIARLRNLAGVRSVARVAYRQRMSITANDPYYAGFTGTTAPYHENAATPGQWDMHVVNLDGAWSQFSSAPVIGAPIAIIDTGVDVTHPELITPAGVSAPKIARTQCFVTYPSSSAQTTGPYVTDTDGHGTNVAGIADGDANNNFAFASVAFDASLLAYRIFPSTPASGCDVQNPPAQCEASSADEASAINDAVAHGAKVINLSLGANPPCSSGDPEYIAVENAIAHGVVVVAAAGNGSGNPAVGQPYLDCPAADPGVIAVGATSLNDTNPLNIFEYVASYSNYLSNNGGLNGGAFVVAPGGDPTPSELCSSCAVDHLHWIEHIYSTSGTGISAGGTCAGGSDYAGEKNDCNVLIAGTSQATPHVVGVVSLMLAKNPNLTPAQIATGLCASADNIGDAKQGCGRVNAYAAVTWAAAH